jgi:hypothetical protein
VFVGREQIRWWLQTLVQQHVRLDRIGTVSATQSASLEWQGSLGMDSLRQVGIDTLPTQSTATIDDGELSSLTILPTPDAARLLANLPAASLASSPQQDPVY